MSFNDIVEKSIDNKAEELKRASEEFGGVMIVNESEGVISIDTDLETSCLTFKVKGEETREAIDAIKAKLKCIGVAVFKHYEQFEKTHLDNVS